ncbi:UNVERIFIED_CONTAM: hypothetical protein FKN15_025673 [Acipenser sinensis]
MSSGPSLELEQGVSISSGASLELEQGVSMSSGASLELEQGVSMSSGASLELELRLTVQMPQSYSVGGQRSSGQLTGKPAGARPDYSGRWCTVSRGHPGRPNLPSPRATLGQLNAAPWKLPSTVGCGIAWTRT